MIDLRLPTPAGPRLVEALLIAAGVAPRPQDPDDRAAYLALANDLGEGLDTLPSPTRTPAGPRNVAAAADAGAQTNHPAPAGPDRGAPADPH